MAVSQHQSTRTVELPDGAWRVDPQASNLTFRSRGVFGLVPVRGTFGDYEGELDVAGGQASGALRINAATLDTKNAKRDTHLRSADFFHVTEYPTVTFSLIKLAPAADGTLTLKGTLRIRDNELIHVRIADLPRHHVWTQLARQANLGQMNFERGLIFDTALLAVEYALSGEGLALVDVNLFAEELRSGTRSIRFRLRSPTRAASRPTIW